MLTIRQEFCKGCGLCVDVCPKHLLIFSTDFRNQKGYYPIALQDKEACVNCGRCTFMCPDQALLLEE